MMQPVLEVVTICSDLRVQDLAVRVKVVEDKPTVQGKVEGKLTQEGVDVAEVVEDPPFAESDIKLPYVTWVVVGRKVSDLIAQAYSRAGCKL